MNTISGTTADCLQHFFRSYNWLEVQALTGKFARVNKGTVRRWYNGNLPMGTPMLCVRVLLDLAGYEVEEFTILPEPVKQFGRLIAVDAISVNDARELLDYAETQEVYRIVLKGNSLLQQRQQRLSEFVDEYASSIEEQLVEAREALEQLTPLQSPAGFGQFRGEDAQGVAQDTSRSTRAWSAPASADDHRKPPTHTGDSLVLSQPSSLDGESLARALVHAVRLTSSLASALDTCSSAAQLRCNVRFALGLEDVDAAIAALEKVRNS